MSDRPEISVDVAVGGMPAGPASSVNLDLSVTAVVPLPAVRVEVDEMHGGLTLQLVHGADGFQLVPTMDGPDGPSGAGIALELPGVAGGGQLDLDNGEWRGAVTLTIGPIKVGGYALLGPNSFLIVLSGRFPQPGIQIGLGFAVSGVGGIFGVNRRSDTAALTAAVLDGSLGNLLFPNDPERDMPRMLAILPRMFPTQTGQSLLGPMFEINWGGGLFKAQAALILEAPDPVRLTCIGRLIVDLPPDVAVVHLQATFAAIADFSVPEFRLVASLTGSYIVGLTLTGDLLVLIRGGPDATFVLSAGGFHPAVHPPAGVPALQRIGMAIGFAIAELRYEAYFAVTTVSVQFGAKAELHASVADCEVHGWLAFDALVEQVPRVHFTVDISAGVEVRAFGESLLGVRLSGTLEGPAPWHINAHGEIEVLFVSASITIDQTFGDTPSPITFVPHVGDQLATALADAGSWAVHPPAADTDGVVLSPAAAASVAAGAVLHPAGRLELRQRLVPFGLTIDRFGGYAVPEQRWQLDGVRLRAGGALLSPTEIVTDAFALGMFRAMTAEEQVSTTSFSLQPCGGVFSPSGVTALDPRTADFDWDTVVVGPDLSTATLDPGHLAALASLDLVPFVPSAGRPIDIAWPPDNPVSVLPETPAVVVVDAPIVGLVPSALTAPFASSAAAFESARQFAAAGTAAAVVEQWELS
ncbi:MAG TPA: DUF6603 domain-containing protein [Mycobacterium sp.]|jgi:hypothetical protein|nr:DUF6603 domain-containing protein [Mycobacterium sp.]